MSYTLTGKLVVAISSRALFDFEEENRIFESTDDSAYMKLQLERLSEAAQKGVWETIGKMDEDKVNARVGIAQQFGFGLLKNAELTKQMMDDYLRANQNDPEIKRIRELADMDAQFAGNALLASLPRMGKPGMDAYGKIVDRLFPAAQDPVAAREALAKAEKAEQDALIARENAQTQAERNAADLALKRAQAEKAKAEAEGRGTGAMMTQAQIKANELSERRMQLLEQQADPSYRAALAAAEAEGRARGESAASKVAQQNAAVATLASVGYNPVTGEDDISRLIAKSTSGGLQATGADIARYFGGTTEGMTAINELQAAANSITTDILGGRLGAGISNTDREFILAALGDIGNPEKTAAERFAGWTRAKNRMVQVGMLPKPRPREAAQQQTQTPQPAPAGGAPRQPTVSNW